MDGWKVLFEFFEKTMATNLMVEADSALSREVKLSTLSEEITRRLRNTSLDLESSCRLEILERVLRIRLETSHPGYQPLYQKAGWRRRQ